jgi:hypothetical protein
MRGAAYSSGCARCGVGAGQSASKYQSLSKLSKPRTGNPSPFILGNCEPCTFKNDTPNPQPIIQTIEPRNLNSKPQTVNPKPILCSSPRMEGARNVETIIQILKLDSST